MQKAELNRSAIIIEIEKISLLIVSDDSIIFEIKNIVDENKTGGFEYYDINGELEEFSNGRCDDRRPNVKRPLSGISSSDYSSRGGNFIRK